MLGQQGAKLVPHVQVRVVRQRTCAVAAQDPPAHTYLCIAASQHPQQPAALRRLVLPQQLIVDLCPGDSAAVPLCMSNVNRKR